MSDNIWSIHYRPKTISDTVLPVEIKKTFQAMVDKREFPNLLLVGKSGCGKTTCSLAMLDELGYDVYKVNGSLNGNIDTLRNEISEFASSVSFTGSRKCVFIDEADGLSQQTQAALRNFTEEWAGNCSFILTANYRNKIIPALQSRCSVIEFTVPKAQLGPLCMEFHGKICRILDTEGITYDKRVVAEVIKSYFPDWRRVVNELQKYASTGAIDSGILSKTGNHDFATLIGHMKEKDYTSVRAWVGQHSDIEPATLFRTFYDQASSLVPPSDVPQVVVLIAQYQYYSGLVADQEVNFSAFLASFMGSVSFK